MTKKLFFTLITCSFLFSCNSNDFLTEESNQSTNEEVVEIKSFDTKEDFNEALQDFDVANKLVTRANDSFYSADEYYDDAAGDSIAEKIGFMVPDERYRNFLNKNMEIIVNDTLYKITKDGTFYTAVNNKAELYKAIENINAFKQINDNLKELGCVKLKNTFGTWDGTKSTPLTDNHYFDDDDNDVEDNNHGEDDDQEICTTRSSSHRPLEMSDIDEFPVVGAVDVSIIDKILHFYNISYMKDTKITFKSNKKRRLYVSLYKYDYGFGVSIGIDCKVMKKLWHGLSWGRMVNWGQGLYYGMSSLVIKQTIKEPVFNNIMNGRAFLDNQWKSVNNYSYSTYASATSTFNGGIVNKWTTEYNGNPTKSPYVIPVIGESAANFVENLYDNTVSRWYGGFLNRFTSGESLGQKAGKALDNLFMSQGISYMKRLDTSDSGQQLKLFSEKEHAIYSIYQNDLTWNGGGYRVKDTFMKYMRNIEGGWSSKGGFSGRISDNDIVGVPSIIYCDGIIFTEDGDGWIGARIKKNDNE